MVAFIVLLMTSAIFLSVGESNTANSVAVYAFYALVLGVILQIASYVRYGEGERQQSGRSLPATVSPPKRWRVGKRTLVLVLVVMVIIATTSGVLYLKPSRSTTTTGTQSESGPFSIGVGFIKEIPEPNDAFQILVGVNQTGGIQPFDFTAHWSDGVNQSNAIGVFTRSFQSNQTIPSAIRITANSSDGQSASTMVTIPAVSRTVVPTSTTESSTSTLAQVVFVESGLPQGSLWSVSLAGESFDSNSSKVAFNYPEGGKFIFTIAGPYDENFAWASVPTPRNGTIVVNGSNDINIVFSNQTVSTPPSRLFVATGSPSAISAGPNTEELNITYVNTFPDQVEAIVLATARNNETGSTIIQTATIEPETNRSQAAIFIFNSLPSGNYSASFVVESTTGVILSATTNVTFTVGG